VFLGAGSAGIGVADQIVRVMMAFEPDLTEEVARKRFYFIDSDGLLSDRRAKNKFQVHKLPYVRSDVPAISSLLEVVSTIKATAIIGLSGQGGVFNEEILLEMGRLNKRPIVFSLSNPTANSECTAEEAYRATDGRVIFASGSPFAKVTLPDGREFIPGQGNNMYVFPGLGFGAWLCQATKVSDKMITSAALALANEISDEGIKEGQIYPGLGKVREISARVATQVIVTAFEEGLATIEHPGDILKFVTDNMYPLKY